MGMCTWQVFDTLEGDFELEFGGELCWVVQHADVENVNLGHILLSAILPLPETLPIPEKNVLRINMTKYGWYKMIFKNDSILIFNDVHHFKAEGP